MSANEKVTPARIDVKIYGRVQMVMFRDFAVRKARALGIVGEVRNMADGSVFAVGEGSKEALETWLSFLEKGPILAKVEHLDVRWAHPTGVYSGFHIKYG